MAALGTVAPWKQLLLNALDSNANLKHSSFFQLATIGSNGRPANRTVVFRGFQDASDKIQINTDCRSCKVEDIKLCSFAEQRERAWFGSSPRSRLQYLGPSPGLPCITEEPSQEPLLDPSTGPVGAFCLLIMDPEQVDYLNLKSNKRLAFTSKQNDEEGKCWNCEKLNP